MSRSNLERFILSFAEDISSAMNDSDSPDIDPQYRLGVRRLAKAFFDKAELFDLEEQVPALGKRDVDAWYAGREAGA